MTRFVDLSHPVVDGTDPFPGLPAPRIEPYITRAASRDRYGGLAEFEISRVFLVGNSGTYLDSPFHRFAGRDDIAGLPLERIAGLAAIRFDARFEPDERAVAAGGLPEQLEGSAVLVHTGWSRRRGTAGYWAPGPYLSAALVDQLIDRRVALVGFDGWNVDDVADLARPAHTRLLEAGILIVEHLTHLDALPARGFRFTAVPAPIRGVASFPVRAFAELDETAGPAAS
ncbi:MAG TPA: cyclase family protein [Candidatus Limnocylindrales bacterium]|nr:cyclase family protein [Candidatus Limnocylindrales bacterium]